MLRSSCYTFSATVPHPFPLSLPSQANRTTQSWLDIVAHVLRLIFYPLRLLSYWLFPSGDLDGLSAAVTAKAAQQFVTYLQSIQGRSVQDNRVSDIWQATGFHALRQEAVEKQSLLLVYLHSPLHRQADVVSKNLLCDSTILQQLQDLLALGVSVHTALGAHLQQILQITSLPGLAVLEPSAGSSNSSNTLQLLLRAQGPALLSMPPSQLRSILRSSILKHQSILAEQTARRLHREQEAQLRRTQDEEYQQALAADQERERLARQEQEQAANEEAAKEQAQRDAVQERERALQEARDMVQPEPSEGGARLRLVLPSGTKLNRRFRSDDTIAVIKAFLFLHFQEQNSNIVRIGLSTNFPKKEYTEDGQTLQDAGLVPQAVLMVQDLDA